MDRSQRDLVDACRGETSLDRNFPLGSNPRGAASPEFGLSVREYFMRKHGPDGPGPGRFFPLHLLSMSPGRRR